jgi:hypothetical protein
MSPFTYELSWAILVGGVSFCATYATIASSTAWQVALSAVAWAVCSIAVGFYAT